MIAGNPAVLENFYTADYELIDDQGNVQDRAARIQSLTTVVDVLDAKSVDIKVVPLSKNVALITGRSSGRYQLEGKVMNFAHRYTSIWVTEDNQWRIRHEHLSSVQDER